MKVPVGPISNAIPTDRPPMSAPSQTDLLMAAATMHSAGRLFEKPPEPKPTDDK